MPAGCRGTRPGVLSDESCSFGRLRNSQEETREEGKEKKTLEARQSQISLPRSLTRGRRAGESDGKHLSVVNAEPYVDELGVVTLLQVVEDRSIVEVGQIRHVLAFLVLGRVHLLQLVLLEVLGLSPRRGKEREKKRRWLETCVHGSQLT